MQGPLRWAALSCSLAMQGAATEICTQDRPGMEIGVTELFRPNTDCLKITCTVAYPTVRRGGSCHVRLELGWTGLPTFASTSTWLPLRGTTQRSGGGHMVPCLASSVETDQPASQSQLFKQPLNPAADLAAGAEAQQVLRHGGTHCISIMPVSSSHQANLLCPSQTVWQWHFNNQKCCTRCVRKNHANRDAFSAAAGVGVP